jgi:pimeloyl-ACP methyl ester carboxylesterase
MTDHEYVAMDKSTIVRSYREPWLLPLLQAGNRALSALAPSAAARLAERLFLTPPRAPRPAAESALLATAVVRPRWAGARRIATATWGRGPTVLLVHGWGGRGTQLGSFVEPLVARGFSVVAFDAPGHGASDAGMVTIPEMVAAVRAVAAMHCPLAGMIAHSLGATVATRALYEGLEVGAAVFVGPAADLTAAARRFTENLGFSREVTELMRRQVERRVGTPWSAFDISTVAPALSVPLLVVHDRGDAEVPWQHGTLVARAWRGAEMLMTDGLGHRRILRDPDVLATATAFLGARTAAPSLARAAGEDMEEALRSWCGWCHGREAEPAAR